MVVPDGNITPEYDRVFLGGSLPRYLYGGNIQLLYKNFDFQIVIQGVGKQNEVLSPEYGKTSSNAKYPVPSIY